MPNLEIAHFETKHYPHLIQDFFQEINRFRSCHGVRPLVYEENLASSAQETANTLARIEKLELTKYTSTHYGEITARLFNVINNMTGAQMAAAFYTIGETYDYSTEETIEECKSFTQLVWAASEEVGLGIRINPNGDAYFVGHFMPKGNIEGHFRLNVFPRLSKPCCAELTVHELNCLGLKKVNSYRKFHNNPDLYICLDLMYSAQERANYLAQQEEIVANWTPFCDVAESVDMSSDPLRPIKIENAIEKWYATGKSYDYSFEVSDSATNCFTQLIWNSTTEIGFAKGSYKGNSVIVAHFRPAGNVMNKYQINIKRQNQIHYDHAKLKSINKGQKEILL